MMNWIVIETLHRILIQEEQCTNLNTRNWTKIFPNLISIGNIGGENKNSYTAIHIALRLLGYEKIK